MSGKMVSHTTSLCDKQVIYIILSIPFFWVIGLDQFIWLVIPALIFIQSLHSFFIYQDLSTKHLRPFICALVVSVVLSSISLIDAPSQRSLSYILDLYVIATGMVLLIVPMRNLYGDEYEKLLDAILTLVGISSIIGIYAIIFPNTWEFNSLAYYLLPSVIRDSDLGQAMFHKSLNWQNTTYLLGEVFGHRVRSLFVSPNSFAATVVMVLPFGFYLTLIQRSTFGRLVVLMAISIGLFALMLTISISAIVSFILGGMIALYIFMFVRFSSLGRVFSVVIIIAIACFLAVLFEPIQHVFTEILYLKGKESAATRLLLYSESVRWVLERPWGYAVRHDLFVGLPPLGSHSQYIAILFKFGFIGLFSYLGVLYTIWKKIYHSIKLSYIMRSQREKMFFFCAAWSFVTSGLNQITFELWYDVIAWVMALILWKIILYRNSKLKQRYMVRFR